MEQLNSQSIQFSLQTAGLGSFGVRATPFVTSEARGLLGNLPHPRVEEGEVTLGLQQCVLPVPGEAQKSLDFPHRPGWGWGEAKGKLSDLLQSPVVSSQRPLQALGSCDLTQGCKNSHGLCWSGASCLLGPCGTLGTGDSVQCGTPWGRGGAAPSYLGSLSRFAHQASEDLM